MAKKNHNPRGRKKRQETMGRFQMEFTLKAKNATETLQREMGFLSKIELIRTALAHLKESHEKAKKEGKKISISFPHDFM